MLQNGEVFINLLTDFGFKRIFGTEMNKDLLISFLNALFDGEKVIKDISYQENEHLGTNIDQRRAIFDVYCATEDGGHIIVEMQNVYQKFYKDRSVYYSTFPIAEQAKQGDWNFELKDVYTVGLLNFSFPEDDHDNRLVKIAKLTDVVTKEVFFDKLAYYYVELVNFNKDLTELDTLFDKWIYALKNMQRLMARPAELQERVFKKLFEQAEIAKFTPKERLDYEHSSDAYRDIKNGMDSAKEEGYAKGLAAGVEKGREEGLAAGMEKGILQEKQSTAQRLKTMGMTAVDIASITGLSVDEVDKL